MNNFVSYCFGLRSQIHLFHFQTTSFAEHKALEEFYTNLLELFDGLVETYQWAHGRVSIGEQHSPIHNYTTHDDVVSHIADFVSETKKLKDVISDDDADIQNIIDELMALGNKTLYLLTLK